MATAITLSLVVVFSSFQIVTPKRDSVSQLALASNKFGLKLHETFGVQGNVFSSPVSVFTSLGILYAGSRGSTRREIRQAISYDASKLGANQMGRHFKKFLSSLSDPSGNGTLRIANALLCEQSFPVSEQYQNFVRRYYAATVKEADIRNNLEKTVAEINDWVKNKTEGRITKLLESIGAETVLALLNAVYFKSKWKIPFDSEDTHESTFYNDGSEEISVPTMVMEEEYLHGVFPEYGLEAIKLLYAEDEFSMVVLLPLARDGIGGVERNLSVATLDDILTRSEWKDVIIRLPRFRLENRRDLQQNLQELGMKRAFTELANFQAISTAAPLQVTQIVHSASVDVTEWGTEASGASYVGISGRSGTRATRVSVDHPFLFLIRHEATGAIPFLGRVSHL